MAQLDVIIDFADPNLDSDDFNQKIFDYLIYLEGADEIESIGASESHAREYKDKVQDRYKDKLVEQKVLVINDRNKEIVHKFHFSGEGDSNQTKFELLSNNLKICTKSKNDTVGRVLLSYLRQTVDRQGRADYVIDMAADFMMDDYPNGHTYNGVDLPVGHFYVSEIVNFLARHNSNYGITHDIRNGVYVKGKLIGSKSETIIERFISPL